MSFAPDKTEEQSPRDLPDFGIGDIQLQVHQVSLSTLVQLAVLCYLGQERVLGIKRAARKDKSPLVTLLKVHGAPCTQACSLCLQSRLPWFGSCSTANCSQHNPNSDLLLPSLAQKTDHDLLFPTLAQKTDPFPSQHSPAVNSFRPIRKT